MTPIARRVFCRGMLAAFTPGFAGAEGAPPEDYALFRAYPELAQHLPRVALLSAATPVEPAPELSRELGLNGLWLKRDDLSHPEYGGGKPRKLELFLADALARGARTLVTSGGVGSNHAVATALFGAKYGLRVVLLLLPGPISREARQNLRWAAALGATLELVPSQRAVAARAHALATTDPTVYVIPMGGTSAVGNIGFVNAGLELAEQIHAGQLPEPDAVYLAMGTMGSAAGLALGFGAAGLRTQVVAVRASNPGTSPERALHQVAHETARFLHERDSAFPVLEPGSGRLSIAGAYLGAGYAAPTAAGTRASVLMRAHHAVELEPTYGAKAFAALIDQARTRGGEKVLFWVTSSAAVRDVSDVNAKLLPRELRAGAQH